MKRYFQSGAKKRKLAELNRQTTFGARSKFPIYCRLKRRKNAKFSFTPSARRKIVEFLYGAPKTHQLFQMLVVLPPPLKKFLLAPMS